MALYDVTNAYLGPLLEKHSAGQPLVWEDLVASQAACSAILRQSNNTFLSVSWMNPIKHRNREKREGREREDEESEENGTQRNMEANQEEWTFGLEQRSVHSSLFYHVGLFVQTPGNVDCNIA